MRGGRSAASWVGISAVVLIAAVVGGLAFAAIQHARPAGQVGAAAPIPTFSLRPEAPDTPETPAPGATGASSDPSASPSPSTPSAPTPSASGSPAAEPLDPSAERFLTVGGGAWWRATAGACGGSQPVIERSTDAGASWSDVTPRYRGIGQVAGLDALADGQAGVVAAVGASCAAQYLRTFTEGAYWDSYPDSLARSRYVALSDAGQVVLPSGAVSAPCTSAHGLRAVRDVVALVCDGRAFVWSGDEWSPLSLASVSTLAVDGADVVVAQLPAGADSRSASPPGSSSACDGLSVSRVSVSSPDAVSPVGCAAVMDASAPAAVAVTPQGVVVWSGGELVPVR